MTPPVELRLLGPVEIEKRGVLSSGPSPQARAVLAALALAGSRPVSVDQLIDRLWIEDPPATARKSIQKHVSSLRTLLGGETVVSTAGGYRLALPLERIDAYRFDALLDEAESEDDHPRALLLVEAAIDLWRGDPLADLPDGFAPDRTRLNERYLTGLEHRAELRLASGDLAETVAELEALVRQHPLRERLWALLMTALYRSGRQADALRAFQRLAKHLGEELGIEPSEELKELEERVLMHDESLRLASVEKPRLPSGTVTFLLTDIEGSTVLWQTDRESMTGAIPAHERTVGRVVGSHGGNLVKGLGDGVMAVFPSAHAAIEAALEVQLVMAEHPLLGGRVRVGVHSGEVDVSAGDYFGLPVSTGARIANAAAGGQILVSETTAALARFRLPEGAQLSELGRFSLRGISHPVGIYDFRHPDLPAPSGEIRLRPVASSNMPAQLTSFVGRARELEELAYVIRGSRLVTLVGPGGSGKTRLAIESATGRSGEHRDGAWFVDLARLSSGAQVALAVAELFGLAGQSDRPARDALLDHLSDKQMLLVLDNCEHVADAAADLAQSLLQGAPELRVLATSRELLRLPGEHIYEVEPMDLPESTELTELETYDAVLLFVDRARSVDSQFEMTEANAAAVAEICRKLDGMPLALELAAARVRAFDPESLVALLDDRFRILTSPMRGAGRHQTLRAAVEWSHDLLSESHRLLFRRLSVFQGGFDLESAEAVCGYQPLTGSDVVDLLIELVDKSLVTARRDPVGPTRYRLLGTLRQFGSELLEPEEGRELRSRHALHFCERAEAVAPDLRGPGQRAALRRLRRDYDNYREALRWAFDERPALGVRLATALADFWDATGPRLEAQDWLRQAVAHSESVPPERRIAALLAASDLFVSAELVHSIGYAEEALTEARRVGDRAMEASALRALTWARGLEESVPEAIELGSQALEILRELGDPWEIAWCLERMGQADFQHPERAHEYLTESLSLYRSVGDERRAAMVLYKMAERRMQARADLDEAQRWVEEAVSVLDSLGSTHDGAHALLELGRIVRRRGHPDQSAEILEEAVQRMRQVGDERCTVRSLAALGVARTESGETKRAESALQESLLLGRALGEKQVLRMTMGALGRLMDTAGRSREAVVLSAIADRLASELGLSVAEPADRSRKEALARLRTELGDESFEEAWEAGEAFDSKSAMDYAASLRITGT